MKKMLLAIVCAMMLCLLPAFGAVDVSAKTYVSAPDDLISVNDQAQISSILNKVSNETGLEVGFYVFKTLEDTEMSTPMDAADSLRESFFGDSDAVVLMVAVESGIWQFSTYGTGIKVMYDNAQYNTWSDMVDDIKSGNYIAAAETLALNVSDYYGVYVSAQEKKGPNFGLSALIAAIAGAIGGLIRGGSLKSELKSVAISTTANDCVKKDSFRLTRSGDVFLYRKVERRKIQKDDTTSTTHTTQSGKTAGGVGGRF